jgi:outer membrane protein TolC
MTRTRVYGTNFVILVGLGVRRTGAVVSVLTNVLLACTAVGGVFAQQPWGGHGADDTGAERPDVLIPSDFTPWWQRGALQPLRPSASSRAVDVNMLIVEALRHSARVRAISDNAIVAETAIVRADAEFDVHAFMESKFVRTSVPTGSELEAGVDRPRLREGDWHYRAGLRRKNQHGGRFEVSQRIGTRDSNSEFFVPENQGNARLTLSYNQPLLNGAGRAYNTSLIVLANIDTRIATDRTATELQDHLLAVTEALWELYFQRSVLLQRQRHLQRAEVILAWLEQRRDVDSLDSQIARARAAVAMRRSELIRAATAIRNAEARTRALVNSPDMLANRNSELVPAQPPMAQFVPASMEEALITALENRPEIDAATQAIQAARVRLDIAMNELLPVLDVVLETYVSGLRGDHDIGRSWVDQFSVGEPSYTAGLVFEVPLHRRAAMANQQRRRAELRQLSNQFQATLENLHAEVEIAVREVDTSYREVQAKYHSMTAEGANVAYLQGRWERLAGDDRAASFILEDLLDAQDRLAIAESGFAQAQVEYTLSLTRLNRATGTLLKHEHIHGVRRCDRCLPTILFEKTVTLESLPPPNDE